MTIQEACAHALAHYISKSEKLLIFRDTNGFCTLTPASEMQDIRDGYAVVDTLPAALTHSESIIAKIRLGDTDSSFASFVVVRKTPK